MIKYEPWADSHAPKTFHRTDPTGRWSPIHEPPAAHEQWWVTVLGGAAMGALVALGLWWGL